MRIIKKFNQLIFAIGTMVYFSIVIYLITFLGSIVS